MNIVTVPGINGLGKTAGCEKSGKVILECLKEKFFSSEMGKAICPNRLKSEDLILDNYNPELSNKKIYEVAFKKFEDKTIFLGGDHSVSYSLTRAFLDYCEDNNKEPCLIVFDSHPDLMEPVDAKFPTHEEWLRQLIEDGFPVKNILLIGVRNSDPLEVQYIQKKGIKVLSMNQINEDLNEFADIITEFANGKETYVSLDIDVVDPAFAPATGYPEPGGLDSRQMIYLVQRINKLKTLKGFDIVEVNEKKDKENLTVRLSAKILSELL